MILGGPLVIFAVFLMFGLIQVVAARFLQVRLEHRKGFFGAKAGVLRPWRRTFLQFLRMESSFTRDLPAALEIMFLALAAATMPTLEGWVVLDLPDSFWWFCVFLFCASVFGTLFRWMFSEGERWVLGLGVSEHATIGLAALLLIGISVAATTGADSFKTFQELQRLSGWLIFHRPETIPLFLATLVLGTYIFCFRPFDSLRGSDSHQRWALHDSLPFIQDAVWSQLVVNLFLGGVDPIPVVGSILYIVKVACVWMLTKLVSNYFITLREDQSEGFVLRYLLSATVLCSVFCISWAAIR